MRGRIQSVLELARYKVGDTAWWVVLRPKEAVPEIEEDDKWMTDHHPKVLYERGPYRLVWKSSSTALLPRVHHADFTLLTSLITSRLVIEPFVVCDLIRSKDTGEFFYSNSDNEWMPESCLFDTNVAARREQLRLLRMLKKWLNQA